MISIEWEDGTSAFWELGDIDLDRVAEWIESNIKQADSVGG